MQISTTTPAIRDCLKRIFTTIGNSPSGLLTYYSGSSNTDDVSQNTFAVTITNSYPYWTALGARLNLMQGAVPTDFSTLTAVSSRSADVLLAWNVDTSTGSWVENSDNSIYLTSTDLAYASQSGTATWLWWVSRNTNNVDINHQAVFTVGALGSGEDFELANTSIVAGKGYKLVNGPTLSLPTEYNY